MRSLKRDIKRKVKNSKKPFDAWYDEHKEKIEETIENNLANNRDMDETYGKVKAKRRVPVFVWLIGAGIVLLTLGLTVSILLSRNASQTQIPSQPQIPDLSFGDDFVNVSYMTEDEISAIKEEVPQFSNFLITEATKSTHLEDGSLVMYTIRGELETEDDFYLIEARILYNDNFVFLGRTNYRDFEMTQTIGDTKVSSKYVGKDSDDIYQYLLLSENGNTTVYWSLDSYEGLFDEWVEITFA